MGRISAYIINLLLALIICQGKVMAQDTIQFPLNIRLGMEASLPVIYLFQKTNLTFEGSLSADVNEKTAAAFHAGYTDYRYSQYNYEFRSNGMFFRTGVDFNLLKPKKTMGKYRAGIGLRYGLSHFNHEIPSITSENYWGTSGSSVPYRNDWAHFLELTPGARADIFRNISIGWTVSLRKLIYSGTGKDLKPVYIPGYGNNSKSFNLSVSYFVVWNFPYRKIRIIIKPEEPEEPAAAEENAANQGYGNREDGNF